MANLDITRHRAAPQFHYTGARMQQGRTLLDSDWNEDALLAGEDRRLTLVDLIGAQGSSNSGFNVSNVTVVPAVVAGTPLSISHIDFELQAGSMFVGGLRLACDPGERYLTQADWLRHEFEELPTPPALQELIPDAPPPNNKIKVLTAPPKYRYDLVYLLAWEQPVTVVEDSELRERALGGPDSSARIRRMRRVRVATDVGTDKSIDALATVTAAFNASFNPETAELVSNARLTVTPIAPAGELPCGPQPPSGYVGHEDQAIRVELRGSNSITWGFGDAAPLYRVLVGADRQRITFLNKPRDARHQPKSQQIVEVIPWGAKLPNDEKIAELQGELFQVLYGYDPATGELVLTDKVPEAWTQWLENHREHWSSKDGEEGSYFYLRLWDRGADISSPPVIELGAAPIELGKTGLQVSLDGLGESGDYWVIAARRATPDWVVPWHLLTSEAPHGPRKFITPLAVIRWEAPLRPLTPADFAKLDSSQYHSLELSANLLAVWGPVTAVPIDARRGLQRLCIGSCCTITVGDGDTSHGLVDSLDEALALLPDAGGRICMLPGEHLVAAVLDGRQNVEIHGSGEFCILKNASTVTAGPDFTTTGAPLITLEDCSDITLRNFVASADAVIGVKIHGVSSQCKNILIDRVSFIQLGSYTLPSSFALPKPAVLALGGEDITVRNCRVHVKNKLSYSGALVLGGKRLRILDNWVQGGDYEATAVAECMGGIHVLSQSIDVEVAGNTIHGGWGYGIALGHVLGWDDAPGGSQTILITDVWTAAERGLGEPVTNLFGYAPVAGAPVGDPGGDAWTSAGALVDVRIDRNHITSMGLTGISTAMMRLNHSPAVGGEQPAFIVIARLSVTSNIVVGNRRASSFSPVDLFAPRADGCCELAAGGIVIAAVIDATIVENRVVDNGADGDWPNCGLGFIAVQNLVLRDNYVADNGHEPAGAVRTGLGAGVAIMEITALRGNTYKDTIHHWVSLEQQPSFSVDTSKLALQMHENEIVHRAGRALWVHRGFDDIVVTNNSFSGRGNQIADTEISDFELVYGKPSQPDLIRSAAGACVEILGFSLAPDVDWGVLPTPGIMMVEPGALATTGGTIQFSGNHGELVWTKAGGYAAAYLISSQDSVVLADNLLFANMNGGGGAFDESFLDDLLNDQFNYSFVISNCYVGTVGGALVHGNRFVEGKRDALLSLVIGPALQDPTDSYSLRNGVAFTSCVGTHCAVTFAALAGTTVDQNNVAIFKKPLSSPNCIYATTFTAGPPHQVTVTWV